MRRLALPMAVMMIVLVATPGRPVQDSGAQAVATVQALFDAMAAKDGDALAELLLPEGAVVSFRGAATEPTISRQQDLVAGVVGAEATYLERMWEPQVLVHGPIAQLWAPYDFWIDGEFSHCGIDSFSLARGDAGWRIVGISYTVERDGCEPSPLGPPQ